MKGTKQSAKLKDGIVKETFTDGTLSATGKIAGGKKVGLWKYYYRSGGLKATGKYKNGQLDGPWKWYRESGKLMQTGSRKWQAVRRRELRGRKEDWRLEDFRCRGKADQDENIQVTTNDATEA